MMISIWTTPPPVVGYRVDNIASISCFRTKWNRRNNLPGAVSVLGFSLVFLLVLYVFVLTSLRIALLFE